MNNSIKTELLNHINDLVNDEVIDSSNFEDWHQIAFNDDYYIIGYWNASEWLKKHDLDAFEAIEDLIEYQKFYLDRIDFQPSDINSEYVVNQLAYWYGYDLDYTTKCFRFD